MPHPALPMRLILAFVVLLLGSSALSQETSSGASSPRVDVHLYGGDMTPGAPLAAWYHSIGITDVWLYPVQGAFPQDQRPGTQKNPDQLTQEGTLANYRNHSIRYWWFERPVPDFLYHTTRRKAPPELHLWDSSGETDALWAGVCQKIREIYPAVRHAGFSGLVYDNEAYYSPQHAETDKQATSVWQGHEKQYGPTGNYYRRGLEVGRAIHDVWPDARVIMVYAFGYEGERWWYQGVQDGGVAVLLGQEHTYGAGPGDLGSAWYQSWWGGRKVKQNSDWKRSQFPFVASNQQILAGLFPIDFGQQKPNYRAADFREQLRSAAQDDTAPLAVWLWPQGAFTPESWQSVHYADGDNAEAYFQPLREFSSASEATNQPQ